MNGTDGPPSILGVLAISVAALVVTSFAVVVVAVWDPNNVSGNVILDAIAIFTAFWVDSRAIRAWRNF